MTQANPEPSFPNNIEAERCILGAVLLDNHALNAAVERLRAEDFFLAQHRHIFECMIQLDEKRQGIDTVTLMEDLTRAELLEAAGGVAYLSQLADGLPRASNVEHYARIVKQKAVLRSVIHATAAIQEEAREGTDDGNLVIERAESMLAQLREDSAKENTVVVYTPMEICSRAPESVEYVSYPFAIKGMMSLVDGHPKLAGKTTLLLTAVGATKRKKLFLNQATRPCKILYVTEEGSATFAIALRKAGIDAVQSDISILLNHEMFGWSWLRKARFIEKICREQEIDWLIIDTFFEIVGLDEEKENDSASVNAAARPLRQIASKLGCAVTLTRHERKAGGEVGTSGRGSNALAGTVDIIVRVRRLPGNRDLQKREIEVVSRIENAKLHIELRRDTNQYVISSREDIWDPETGETVPGDLEMDPNVLRVVAFVKSNGSGTATREEIKKHSGIKRERAVDAISRALKAALLVEESKGVISFPKQGTETPSGTDLGTAGTDGNAGNGNAALF